MAWYSCTMDLCKQRCGHVAETLQNSASAAQRKMAEKVVVGLLWLYRSDTGATTDVSSWEHGNKQGNWRNAMSE